MDAPEGLVPVVRDLLQATQLPKAIQLMTPRHAQAIWAFVDKHKAVPVMVVRCEMGMSRSPDIAAAITRDLGGDDDAFLREYLPNRYVYDLMLEARGIP